MRRHAAYPEISPNLSVSSKHSLLIPYIPAIHNPCFFFSKSFASPISRIALYCFSQNQKKICTVPPLRTQNGQHLLHQILEMSGDTPHVLQQSPKSPAARCCHWRFPEIGVPRGTTNHHPFLDGIFMDIPL